MAVAYRMDGWVKSVLGQAVAGALIYVCTQPANTASLPPSPLASIFSDPNGLVPIVQPIAADGFGHYDFYAAPGTYTVVVANFGVIQQVYPDQSIFGFASTAILTPGANIAITGLVISAVGLVQLNPVADQSIVSRNLLPATSNPTGQSLGNAGAPWDATLYDLAVQDSMTFGHPGALSEIVMSGATDPWFGLIRNAILALPAGGGLIDARAVGVAAIPQGTVNLTGKPGVTILLGPYTYTFTNITVTTGTKILGSTLSGTNLYAADTTTSLITMDQTTTVTGVELGNFALTALAGSAYTQNGIAFILNGTTNTGLWYSSIHDIIISGLGPGGFGGMNMVFDGSAGGDGAVAGHLGLNQFNNIAHVISFRKNVNAWVYGTSYVPGNTVTINNGNVTTYSNAVAYAPGSLVILPGAPTVIYMAFFPSMGQAPPNGAIWQVLTPLETALTYVNVSPTSTAFPTFGGQWQPYESYSLKISGYAGQLFFDTCEFDSQFGGPNSGINIAVYSAGNSAGFTVPNGITFRACTIQFASLGALVAGTLSVHFIDCHHEALRGGYLLDTSNGFATDGCVISGGFWATGIGLNGGAGYAVQFTSALAPFGDVVFSENAIFNPMDNMVIGNGCLSVVVKDNAALGFVEDLGAYSGCVPTVTATVNMNAGRNHCIYVTGTTAIKDMQSLLGPGEMISVIASTGGVNFITGGSGGSQFLLGTHSSFTLEVGGGATFVRSDSPNMNGWVLVGATP